MYISIIDLSIFIVHIALFYHCCIVYMLNIIVFLVSVTMYHVPSKMKPEYESFIIRENVLTNASVLVLKVNIKLTSRAAKGDNING